MRAVITRLDTKNARHELHISFNIDEIIDITLYTTTLQTDRHISEKTLYKTINNINDDKLAMLYKELNYA